VEERYAHDEVRTIGRLPGNILHGMVGVWNRDNLTPAAIGGVGTIGAWHLDDAPRSAVARLGVPPARGAAGRRPAADGACWPARSAWRGWPRRSA